MPGCRLPTMAAGISTAIRSTTGRLTSARMNSLARASLPANKQRASNRHRQGTDRTRNGKLLVLGLFWFSVKIRGRGSPKGRKCRPSGGDFQGMMNEGWKRRKPSIPILEPHIFRQRPVGRIEMFNFTRGVQKLRPEILGCPFEVQSRFNSQTSIGWRLLWLYVDLSN